MRHYRGLAKNGVTVDFVDEDSDLSGYKLVVVPMLYLLREDFAGKLRDFTAAGGTLVVTYWSGVVNETDLCWLGDMPHGLTEVLGLRRTEIDGMYDGETRKCSAVSEGVPPQASGSILCEVAVPEGAETLMVYDEDFFKGAPAVARNRYGEGWGYYLAARFEKEFYPPFYQEVCAPLFAPVWPSTLPEGVLATKRGQTVFLQNTSGESVTVDGQELPGYGTMAQTPGRETEVYAL